MQETISQAEKIAAADQMGDKQSKACTKTELQKVRKMD
jgi:hypothetical protein